VGLVSLGAAGWAAVRAAPAATPVPVRPASAQLAQAAPPSGATLTPRVEAPPAARSLSAAFAATARALRPSVVRIDVEAEAPRVAQGPRRGSPANPFSGQVPEPLRRFFHEFGEAPDFPGMPMPAPVSGVGSGFILDSAGHVLTNSHVIARGGKLKVTLVDGQEIPARVVGRDSRTDVAVVRLEKVPAGLTAARLGDSSKLEVGEWVLAIGSPLSLEQTVTVGIVSSKGRVGRNIQMSGDRVREYIQTDAKINPGNSGGPLVNLDGEVVGMNTLIRVGAGGAYGFAVPINEARRVAQVLIKDGRVRYPLLGVNLTDVDDLPPEASRKLGPRAPTRGAYVTEVPPGSPAASAGVKPGDIITRIDDRDVRWAIDVVDHVSTRAIGASVNLQVWRDGAGRSFRATLTEAPSEDSAAPTDAGPLGLALQTLTPSLAESLGVPRETKGTVIAEVQAGSPAEQAGLQAGEVIVEVDRKPVATADQAAAALKEKRPGGHLLRVRGPQGSRFVNLR
jgi:serine protease Do